MVRHKRSIFINDLSIETEVGKLPFYQPFVLTNVLRSNFDVTVDYEMTRLCTMNTVIVLSVMTRL